MEMTREIMFEQFAKLKTNNEKVKYLVIFSLGNFSMHCTERFDT